jgi:peptidoglycan/LPS O-acetylase OafA/YrhL
MRRLAPILVLTVALALAAAPALAQDGNPFNPLPPAPPAPTATPQSQQDTSDDDVGRRTLYVIGGGLLAFFVFMAWWISRDARRTLPADHRPGDRLREEGPHRHERRAKAKARQKGRAQRQARRKSRSKRG